MKGVGFIFYHFSQVFLKLPCIDHWLFPPCRHHAHQYGHRNVCKMCSAMWLPIMKGRQIILNDSNLSLNRNISVANYCSGLTGFNLTSNGVSSWARNRKSLTVLNITVAELNDSETLYHYQRHTSTYLQISLFIRTRYFIFIS